MRTLIRRICYLLRHRRHDAELEEEIAFHRAMTERALEAEGKPRTDAAIAARRVLGNDLAARGRSRDVWVWPWLQDISQDVRFAMRLLAKERWFTSAAVVALALGIGANTTVFTLVNAITWRGLPVAEPHRIVTVYTFDQTGRRQGVSYPEFRDWQAATQTFDGLAALSGAVVNIGDPDRAPDRVTATYVSWNTFRLLGDRPMLGRDFVEADEPPGAPAVIVLGYRVWRDRYGSDANIVGRAIAVDGRPAVVIGVMPDGFQFPALSDAWLPLGLTPGATTPERRTRSLRVFGRLAKGVGRAQAAAEVNGIATRLAADYPETNTDVRAGVEPFTGTANEPFLFAMFAAVGFVLFIACANVASLLIARASRRAREIALRVVLGASRWRVTRQLLVESLLMAILAAGLGLLFAKLGMLLFVGDSEATAIAYWVRWEMDGRVFRFLLLATLGTLVLFGVAPALYLSRGASAEALKDGGRTSTGGVSARRSTGALLVAELALTLVLLAGASLMIRSLLAIQARDLVIDSSRLLTAGVTPSKQKYSSPEQRIAFVTGLETRLRAIPILASATLTSHLPFINAGSRRLAIDGQGDQTVAQPPIVLSVTIGDGYFATLELPILLGRAFTEVDGTAGHDNVIVNRAFVARFFPNHDPIGRRIRLTAANAPSESVAWTTIVGVAPTVRQQPQTQTVDAVVYLPLRATLQSSLPDTLSLMVRTDADPAALAGTLREELRRLDPDLAVSRVLPLDFYLRQAQWSHRLFSRVFGVFAGVALLLSAVGLYAVTAYAVGQRTQEIGVRMALGAQRGQVLWLFARRLLLQLSVGLALGLAGALGLGTLLRGLLVQTSPTDPVTLMIAIVCLVAPAIVATLIPARRAMRLDPVLALRHD